MSATATVISTNPAEEDALSVTFSALADPTRRAILGRLSRGEATVAEHADPFEISLPAVSRHLKVLESAGLIARRKAGRERPSTIVAAPLKEAAGWLESYREVWEDRLGRLDDHLQSLQEGER